MAKLKFFLSLDEKQKSFSNKKHFTIDTKEQFDEWFNFYTSEIKEGKRSDYIWRGMGDASHKLYTSAQRIWIQNDMHEWCKPGYIGFIDGMVQEAKKYPLIKKVFDIYGYTASEREFPILSILQHYWAPTPLMDWTYNINVALFFATEKVPPGNGISVINDYFSIYRINKAEYRNEFLNLPDFTDSAQIKQFSEWSDNTRNPNQNGVFYISDLEDGNALGATPMSTIKIRNNKPLTSIYNQNIIPQEGLFIFNPFSEKTIDEVFNTNLNEDGWNLALTKFSCFNIKKDLAEYVRRRINNKERINRGFIYPHIYDDAETIKNNVLNQYAV